MSDSGRSDQTVYASSIAPESDESNRDAPALSEVSPRDKPWDKHKAFADRVEALYRGTEFASYAERIHFCADLLKFGLVLQDDSSLKLKLRAARFCRCRFCCVCQHRRSLRWKAKAYEVLPKIVADYPSYRWLFLTLTQKNVPIAELRSTLTHMNQSFKRMTKLKAFPAKGWLRSTEVTRGRDGKAHPHFHCLLLVPSSYFSGRGYMKQSQWVAMWRQSMRLDYNPVLDVQAVKQGSKPMELIPELLKYVTKESDLVADRQWLIELTKQMHKMRAISTGGVLKEYLKELEDEPEDLIGSDGEDEVDEGHLFFGWRRPEKRYRMLDR